MNTATQIGDTASRARCFRQINTPSAGNSKPISRQTQLTEPVFLAIRSSAEFTHFVNAFAGDKLVQLIQGEPAEAESPSNSDQVSRTREDRLALLAKRYEGNASVEDAARIELLTVRLRRLDPRVTEHERNNAEEIMQSMESVEDMLREVRAQFAL